VWLRESHPWGWGQRPVGTRVHNQACDASCSQPLDSLASHLRGASGDASAVSQRQPGPTREPWHVYAVSDWRRQGPDGFLGHPRCQGPPSGLRARRHEALILMGGWCGANPADTPCTKTGMRLRPQVGGGVCRRERNGKTWSNVMIGRVLSLDKSLLMGGVPIRYNAPPPVRPHHTLRQQRADEDRINPRQ
jgi:hypothetical protein